MGEGKVVAKFSVTLNNVQVTENLATTFPSPITYTVVSKSSAATDLNAGFLGTPSSQNLLTGSGTLAANASNTDRKSTRMNSSHRNTSRMPSSA